MIASMWVGNLMLVVLNLPLIGMWIKLLTVPYRLPLPGDPACSAASACTASTTARSTCYMMALFGVLGYVCVKLECEPAPLILGFILGPMMEENLRRAMLLSRGDPIGVLHQADLGRAARRSRCSCCIIVLSPSIKKKREEAFQEA